jgi:hypothetical protein
MTWYSASSSSAWDVSKMLTRPSVLEESRRVGCAGWSCRDVMVSVCDSTRESVGAEGLRWSLACVQRMLELICRCDLPHVDWGFVGSIFWVLDAGSNEVSLGIAYQCGDELVRCGCCQC